MQEARLSQDFQQVVTQVFLDHKQCITRRGYSGLVPAMTTTDDAVGQFLDAPAPSIWRRNSRSGHSVLIGEASIPDLTDGEAFKPGLAVHGPILLE